MKILSSVEMTKQRIIYHEIQKILLQSNRAIKISIKFSYLKKDDKCKNEENNLDF